MKLYTLVCETERDSYVIKINYYNEDIITKCAIERTTTGSLLSREKKARAVKREEREKKKKKGNFATDPQLKAARMHNRNRLNVLHVRSERQSSHCTTLFRGLHPRVVNYPYNEGSRLHNLKARGDKEPLVALRRLSRTHAAVFSER